MSKFKVGDRVRFTEDNPDGGSAYGAKGAVAKIVWIRDEVGFSGSDVDIEPIGWTCVIKPEAPSRVLEPYPAFKVGDRVRATKSVPKGRVGAIIEDDGIEPRYRVRFDDWADGIGDRGREWWLDTDELESAPLAIVAGRYYKTRDGRKVGPATTNRYSFNLLSDSSGLVAGANITEMGAYTSDGRWLSGGGSHDHDIIAEWTDPAIVALIENGQPKPATEPFVHPDRGSAETESKRLAGKHPGKEFGVYELVSSTRVEPEHEWQRLAAKGDEDGAVARLVADVGITRANARNAVRSFVA